MVIRLTSETLIESDSELVEWLATTLRCSMQRIIMSEILVFISLDLGGNQFNAIEPEPLFSLYN